MSTSSYGQYRQHESNGKRLPVKFHAVLASNRMLEPLTGQVDNGAGFAIRSLREPKFGRPGFAYSSDISSGYSPVVIAAGGQRGPTLMALSSNLDKQGEPDVHQLNSLPAKCFCQVRVPNGDGFFADQNCRPNEDQVRNITQKNGPTQSGQPSLVGAGYNQHETNQPNDAGVEESILGIKDVTIGHATIFAGRPQVER